MDVVSPAVFVLALLALIGLINLAVWGLVIRWWRRSEARLYQDVVEDLRSAEARGERLLRGPELGVFRGTTVPGYPSVKGNCILALTDQRLLVRRIVGRPFEVPDTQIRGVRQDAVFLSSSRVGHTHVIIELDRGEIGLFVGDNQGWVDAFRTIAVRQGFVPDGSPPGS
jgi:hypothetical protein